MGNSGIQDWILILVIISTVLACWSFSLLLRLVSELIARNRKRLMAQYHRKGVVFALIAFGLGVTGSGVAGGVALMLTRRYGNANFGQGGLVAAISFGLVLFALMLLVWAIIGDRPRGRVRCPRCWYDMEGISDPRCPECGKVIKSPRQLHKARRLRWPFGLAGICIGVAVFGFVHVERVEENGMLALVPTWVMIGGWDYLPEDWILEANSPHLATLETRLSPWGDLWMPDTRRVKFMRRLAKGLEGSTKERWNPTRLELLKSVVWHAESYGPDGIFTDLDHELILRRAAEDMYYAVEHADRFDHRVRLVLKPGYSGLPFEIAWRGAVLPKYAERIAANESSTRLWDYIAKTELDGVRFTRSTLASELASYDAALLIDQAISGSITQYEAQTLVSYSGLLDEHLFACMRIEEQTDRTAFTTILHMLIFETMSMDRARYEQLYTRLIEWIEGDELRKRQFALSFLRYDNRRDFRDLPEHPYPEGITLAMNEIIAHTLRDDRNYGFDDEHASLVSQLALSVLINHLTSDQDRWDLAEQSLREFGYAPYLQWSEDRIELPVIAAWIEQFAPYFQSHDPDIRQWVMASLPVGTAPCLLHEDPRIPLIVAGLIDPHEDVRSEAEYALYRLSPEDQAILNEIDPELGAMHAYD